MYQSLQSDLGLHLLQGRREFFFANFLNRPVLLDVHNEAFGLRRLGNNMEMDMINVLECELAIVLRTKTIG